MIVTVYNGPQNPILIIKAPVLGAVELLLLQLPSDVLQYHLRHKP